MQGCLRFTCGRDERTTGVIVYVSEKRSVPSTHAHSIVNPREKLDFIAQCRAWLHSCCASSKVVHTVNFTVKAKRAFLR